MPLHRIHLMVCAVFGRNASDMSLQPEACAHVTLAQDPEFFVVIVPAVMRSKCFWYFTREFD